MDNSTSLVDLAVLMEEIAPTLVSHGECHCPLPCQHCRCGRHVHEHHDTNHPHAPAKSSKTDFM